jgi:hypothetical protein
LSACGTTMGCLTVFRTDAILASVEHVCNIQIYDALLCLRLFNYHISN